MFDISDEWPMKALEEANFGVLVLEQGSVIWLNPYLAKLLELKKTDLLGCMMSSEDRLSTVLLGTDTPFMVSRKNADDVWLKRQVIQAERQNIYFFHDCSDLVIIGNECRRLQKDLSEMNPKDPVTGMISFDHLVQLLDSHISRSRRYDNALSLLRISYIFPAPIEASLLEEKTKQIAFFLKDQLRWADQIGMLDRHTFLVILPETDYKASLTLLNKFNSEAHLALFSTDKGAPLSFSVGLAEWTKGDSTQKMLQNIRQDVDLTMLA